MLINEPGTLHSQAHLAVQAITMTIVLIFLLEISLRIFSSGYDYSYVLCNLFQDTPIIIYLSNSKNAFQLIPPIFRLKFAQLPFFSQAYGSSHWTNKIVCRYPKKVPLGIVRICNKTAIKLAGQKKCVCLQQFLFIPGNCSSRSGWKFSILS